LSIAAEKNGIDFFRIFPSFQNARSEFWSFFQYFASFLVQY